MAKKDINTIVRETNDSFVATVIKEGSEYKLQDLDELYGYMWLKPNDTNINADIFVDDVLVTSVNNTGKYRISEFKYETYDIPANLLSGKQQVRVKFVAKPHRQIGEIYEVRLVKNTTN